jgi:hypothetical protein
LQHIPRHFSLTLPSLLHPSFTSLCGGYAVWFLDNFRFCYQCTQSTHRH